MELIDSAAVGLVRQHGQGGFGIGLLFRGGVPVCVGAAEIVAAVAQTLCDGKYLLGVSAAGGTEQLHFVAEFLQNIVMECHNFIHNAVNGQFGKLRMVGAMASENMPLVNDPLDQLRIAADKVAVDEEDDLHILVFQLVQNDGGQIVVLIATIEAEIDTAVVFPDKPGIILFKSFCQRSSDGGAVLAVYTVARAIATTGAVQRLQVLTGIQRTDILVRNGGCGHSGLGDECRGRRYGDDRCGGQYSGGICSCDDRGCREQCGGLRREMGGG